MIYISLFGSEQQRQITFLASSFVLTSNDVWLHMSHAGQAITSPKGSFWGRKTLNCWGKAMISMSNIRLGWGDLVEPASCLHLHARLILKSELQNLQVVFTNVLHQSVPFTHLVHRTWGVYSVHFAVFLVLFNNGFCRLQVGLDSASKRNKLGYWGQMTQGDSEETQIRSKNTHVGIQQLK